MGLCGGGDTKTVQGTTTTKLPPYLEEYVKGTLENANQVTSRPYEAYQGQRTAEFGQDTNAAFDMTRNNQGVWSPDFNAAGATASDVAGQSVTPFPQIDIGAYMNPYVAQVMNRSLSEVDRQAGIERNDLKGQLAAQGAYGGSRHGVLESEQRRNTTDLKQNLIASLLSNAYSDAGSQYRADVNNKFVNSGLRLDASGQLADLGQRRSQMGYQDAAAMLDIGQRQEGKEQQGLDIGYADFLRQFNYPIEMLNLQTSVASGQPYGTTSMTEQEQLTGNSTAQTLGAFGALAGGLGSLFG